MKIMERRMLSLLYVAVMVGSYAVGSIVFGQTPANNPLFPYTTLFRSDRKSVV